MPVMAAGVHPAGRSGGIGDARLFDDRQRVHVGAQADHAALRVGFPFDHSHYAGAADAFHHLVAAEAAAEVGHLGGRPMHLEQEFGVFVEVAAPGGDFGQKLGEAVLGGHGGSPLR